MSRMENVSSPVPARGCQRGWRLRGVQWRVKLGVLPRSPAPVDALRRATADGRRRYADLRRRLLVDPHIMEDALSVDNPLSLDPESIWGKYFRNAELERTIDKDLIRLCPEHGTFFHSAPCQALMRRILLVWSLIHPQFSYRQGMHELLAPLLYVLHVDVVRLSQVKRKFEELFDDRFDDLSLQERRVRDKVERAMKYSGELILVGDPGSLEEDDEGQDILESSSEPDEQNADLSVIARGCDTYGVDGELGALLSARFVEHDAYCMFDALLSGEGGAVAMAEFFTTPLGVLIPPVIQASSFLYRTLAAADITLYTHLVELGVEPQFFALRWLRLLFGREFALEDLLCVWDAIFGANNTPLSSNIEDSYNCELKTSPRSAFISALAVSMLLYVRPALLAAPDATGCLQRLLKFPQIPDVRDLIDSAKLIQPLAEAAGKNPLPAFSKSRNVYDTSRNSKHARSGSASPPNTHHHILRHHKSTPSSPDVLRMSLPESYWEERWTHSVLHKKSGDELFSPRGEPDLIPKSIDIVDRQSDHVLVLMVKGSSSSSRSRTELLSHDSAGSQKFDRPGSRSFDSGDESGQELLNRAGESFLPCGPSSEVLVVPSSTATDGSDNFIYSAGQDLQVASVDTACEDSVRVADGPHSSTERNVEGLGNQHVGILKPDCVTVTDEEFSTTVSNEQGQGHQLGEPRRSDFFKESGHVNDNDCVDVAATCLKEQRDGEGLILGDDMSKETTLIALDASSKPSVGTGCVNALDIGAANSNDATLLHASQENERCMLPDPTAGFEFGSPQTTGVLLNSSQEGNPVVMGAIHDLSSNSDSNDGNNKEIMSCSEPEGIMGCVVDGDTGDFEFGGSSCLVSSEGVIGSVQEDPSSSVESFKPKPNTSPSPRVGRLNWVWNFGKSSFLDKAVNSKPLKEESSGNTCPAESQSDTDSTAASISAYSLRKPKRWWRSNNDVVPEDCVVIFNGLISNTPIDGVSAVQVSEVGKHTQEPVPLGSGVQPGKEDHNSDMCLSTPEPSKRTKELSPSAALQALGQSMLDHIQVLESALAQRAPILGVESIMWTPAVREKSENPQKSSLGGKGQVAALAAIAELRKISNALQQM